MEDIINSMDIIDRITELEADDDIEEDEKDELEALRDVAEQGASSFEDWEFGVTLIKGTYFTEYAQELAEDTGLVFDCDLAWPNSYIDWDAAAEELQIDYGAIDYDGVEYYARY